MSLCPCGKHTDPGLTFCDWCVAEENRAVVQYLKDTGRYLGHYTLHVSPSQTETFTHGCQRAWGLDKITQLPRPGNKYSERGTAVHSILENWELNATPPDLSTLYGQIAFPALRHIPAPRTPGVIPEREVRWWPSGTPGEGTLWVFLKDLEQPGSGQQQLFDLNPGVTRIWDYKTTSNLDYAKTTDKLLNSDPQGLTYAAHAFQVYGSRSVEETWLYLTANKPHRCHPVQATHDREHCLERFGLLDQIASVMLDHRRAKTNPLQLAPNTGHCSAFGGCPFRGTPHCPLTEEERFLSQAKRMSAGSPVENVQDFLAQIKALQAGSAQPPQAQPPAPSVQTAPAVFPTVGQQVQTSPFPQVAQASAPAAFGAPTPFGAAAPQVTFPAPAAFMPAAPQALNFGPPAVVESVPEVPAFTPPPALPVPEPKKRVRRTKEQIAADEAAKAAQGQQVIDPEESVQAPVQFEQKERVTEFLTDEPLDQDPLDPLVRELALAMACNPACATLPAGDFASRAWSLAEALRGL
jgi:hypothetical protein